MTEVLTQVGVGGILVLLILREVFGFLARRRLDNTEPGSRKSNTDKFKAVQSGVDAVLVRLDRIIERLDDVAEATRLARKQSEITGEMTERMSRAVSMLEETLTEAAGRRRTADTNPGL